MQDHGLYPIREDVWWVERHEEGKLEIRGSYRENLPGWRVRIDILDERLEQRYNYDEFVKLPKTASRDEVARKAISQITRFFERVTNFWLPNLSEAFKPE